MSLIFRRKLRSDGFHVLELMSVEGIYRDYHGSILVNDGTVANIVDALRRSGYTEEPWPKNEKSPVIKQDRRSRISEESG